MLYGRATELAAIDAALEEARQGHGQLLVVVGEAGLGKTTLAEEATRRALVLGFRAAWGRTWEGAGAPPGWPWTQIARELLDEGLPVAPSEAAKLASLVPELAGGEVTDFATFDALLALIKRASRATPRLFVLDDLHAADASTLSALGFIARALRRLPAVIVATHRDAEARVRADVPGLFERIAAEGTRLALARLGPADVAALVTERLGRVAPDAARAIHRSTEGNPLYVHEVVRLVASGRARPEDLERRPPEGILAAVAGHVGLLSASTRSLVGVAALFGRTFSRDGLAAVSGSDEDAIEAALAEATAAGIIAPSADGAAFTHVLITEVLTAALPSGERARLHAAIARWWQSQSVADLRLNEIAHHLLEAGGDPAEAIGWARRAAGRATERLAFDQAAELYARALALVPRLADGERVAIDLLVGRSEALAKAGAFEASLALCKEAAHRARAAGAADLEARAALASAHFFNHFVPHPDVVALLEGALETVARAGAGKDEDADAWRARLLAKLSRALYPSPTPGKTIGLSREAVAIARKAGDADVLLDVLQDVAIDSVVKSLPARDCQALAQEITTLARARERTYPLLLAHCLEVRTQIQLGDMEGVEDRIRTLEEVLRSAPPRDRSSLCLLRAVPALLQGRFAEAEACVEDALQVGLPEDQRRNRALHAWVQAYTRGNREDLAAARAFADIRVFPNAPLWIAAALGELAEGSAPLRTPPSGDGTWPATAALLADACVLAGEAAAAGALYGMLATAAGEALVLGTVACLGPVDRILGGLALLQGDRASALAHFERAVALCERMGAIPFLARTLAQLGRLVQTDDAGRARRVLDRARSLAGSVGMTTLIEEIARALDGETQDRPNANLASALTDPITLAGPRPSPPSMGVETVDLQRDGEEWVLSCGADSVRLPQLKGLLYLEELLQHPHREIHVAELYALGSGRAELGDAGPTLDATARRQYERRLADLEEELREAEVFADPARAARAEQEIDHLALELARAVGMGGRERRAGSLTERSRINVQRRLKEVVTRTARTAPTLARVLESIIKTGTYCSYRPLATTTT